MGNYECVSLPRNSWIFNNTASSTLKLCLLSYFGEWSSFNILHDVYYVVTKR